MTDKLLDYSPLSAHLIREWYFGPKGLVEHRKKWCHVMKHIKDVGIGWSSDGFLDACNAGKESECPVCKRNYLRRNQCDWCYKDMCYSCGQFEGEGLVDYCSSCWRSVFWDT